MFKRDQIYSLLFIKLIILSFVFSLPSITPVESQKKQEIEKYSQLETSSDVAVLKSRTESKQLKRFADLESDFTTQKNSLSIITYSIVKTFTDYKITLIAFHLQSSLARAPPVA